MSVRLEIAGLSHRYRGRSALSLDDVSFAVAPGELVTILGPSGSGKSTLLALIAGIEAPSAGAIAFDGSNVLSSSAADRHVALVLQRPYLFPHLSVGENVAFGLAARGVGRGERAAEADRWLTMVRLDGAARRRPSQLSGGEQQRVALVRGLATGSRLLLLDEPLANLDPTVRGSLQELIREIVDTTGVTALMVTHELSEAMALGDRVAILDHGHLIDIGDPERVLRHPVNRVAAELVGITTFLDGERCRGHIVAPAGALAIRPEHIRVVGEGGPNVVRGRLHRCVFRGEHWDCVVETDIGQLVARHHERIAVGSDCWVSLPGDQLVVLAGER